MYACNCELHGLFEAQHGLCFVQQAGLFGAGTIPSDFEDDNCSIYFKLVPTLQNQFGYDVLKPGQAEAILRFAT